MKTVSICKGMVTTALVGSLLLSGMGNVVFAENGDSPAKSKSKISALSTSGDVTIFIDGIKQSYPQPPVVENGSTLVPLRSIFEALGTNVIWDGENQTVYAYKVLNRSSIAVTLKIGQNTAAVNGVQKELAAPAKVVNGSTLVSLRFISEALGAKVSWDDASRTAKIERVTASREMYQTVPVDNFTKKVALYESKRSEEELLAKLKKAFEGLKSSLNMYSNATDASNELLKAYLDMTEIEKSPSQVVLDERLKAYEARYMSTIPSWAPWMKRLKISLTRLSVVMTQKDTRNIGETTWRAHGQRERTSDINGGFGTSHYHLPIMNLRISLRQE